jgi:uncharacterized membrane protein YdbT with pleckstrin-like domain
MPPYGGASPQEPRRRARRSSRPGAGQSRERALRGWNPDDLVYPYLTDREEVKLEETRSVRGFLLTQVHWMVLGAIVAGLLFSTGQALLSGLGVVVVVGVVGYLTCRAMQAWFTRYVVTDLRILRVSGVLNRQAEFIPWVKVTEITRTESLFQWLAHTATIRIESANERSSFRSIDDVDEPDGFYRLIVEMVDRKQGHLRPDTPGRSLVD